MSRGRIFFCCNNHPDRTYSPCPYGCQRPVDSTEPDVGEVAPQAGTIEAHVPSNFAGTGNRIMKRKSSPARRRKKLAKGVPPVPPVLPVRPSFPIVGIGAS